MARTIAGQRLDEQLADLPVGGYAYDHADGVWTLRAPDGDELTIHEEALTGEGEIQNVIEHPDGVLTVKGLLRTPSGGCFALENGIWLERDDVN